MLFGNPFLKLFNKHKPKDRYLAPIGVEILEEIGTESGNTDRQYDPNLSLLIRHYSKRMDLDGVILVII